MENGIEKYLNETFELSIPVNSTREQSAVLLAERINYLIINDFSMLVQILYRIDVSEQKIKSLLKENKGSDAGKILASLIIERQTEKTRSRQQTGRDDKNTIDETERW